MSDEEIVETTVGEIADFFPRASMERVRHARVHRIPMAIHCPYPGTERRRPQPDAPVDDLLLAGDWIQTHLPASMESAVKAGWRAAELALEREGRHEPLAEPHPPVEGITRLVEQASRLMPGS